MATDAEKLEEIWRLGRFMKMSLDGKEQKLRIELENLNREAASCLARVMRPDVDALPQPISMGDRVERISGKFEAVMALREHVAALEKALGRSLSP